MSVGKLLLDEPPIVVLPSLAKLVGLNESIILQQLHYWLQRSSHARDGRLWIYNTYAAWREQLPFWSEITIKRTVLKLEKQGLILSENFNKAPMDKTKWYSIDYDALDLMVGPSYQNDTSIVSNRSVERIKMIRAIPETTTETTEKTSSSYRHDEEVRICRHFESTFGRLPNDIQVSKLSYFVEKGMELDLILAAMTKARECGKDIGYSIGILRNQWDQGIRTLEHAKLQERERSLNAGGTHARNQSRSGTGGKDGIKPFRRSVTGGKIGLV